MNNIVTLRDKNGLIIIGNLYDRDKIVRESLDKNKLFEDSIFVQDPLIFSNGGLMPYTLQNKGGVVEIDRKHIIAITTDVNSDVEKEYRNIMSEIVLTDSMENAAVLSDVINKFGK